MRLIRLEDRAEIERLHKAVLAPRIKSRLDGVLAGYASSRHQNVCDYVSKLREYSVDDFLVMSVNDMRNLVSAVDSYMPAVPFYRTRCRSGSDEAEFRKLNADLKTCFDYEWFSKKTKDKEWDLWKLAERLNKHLKFCPYCNAETIYAITIKDGKTRLIKSAFDHYFPRGRYPFLGLSLYNLIPACTRCNSGLKGDQYVGLVSMAHPYALEHPDTMTDEDMHHKMKFNLIFNDAKCLSYCGSENIGRIIYSERVKGTFDRGLKWEALFHIGACYTNIYRDDAAVAFRRATAYPQSYLNSKEDELRSAGLPVIGLEEFLYGAPLDQDEINKHRFGKLICDIVETYRK